MSGLYYPVAVHVTRRIDWMRSTWGMASSAHLDVQIASFMVDLPELLKLYEGRYVAYEDGKVLAVADSTFEALAAGKPFRRHPGVLLVRRVQVEYPPVEM